MTVDKELIRIGDSIFRNRDSRLWLPEYVMPEHLNTDIPSEADLVTQSSVQKYPIHAQLMKAGNLYRYCKSGATNTSVGFLKGCYTQCPGKAGNSAHSGFEGAMYAAVAAGATSFTIADTAALKNEYQYGLLVVYNDTDVCYDQYVIIGNDASNGTYTTLYISAPGFKNAITTGYGITIYLNEYADVRILSGGYMSALGYTGMSFTSAYYGWMQTAGKRSGITGASTWPGQTQYNRDVFANTDGSLISAANSTTVIMYQRVGFLLAKTASDYGDNLIMLQLDSPCG